MYQERHAAIRLKRLIGGFPVVVVSGARQVGKTTLLRKELAGWNYVVFDPVQDVAGARADPDLFLQTHSTPLVLDEIQYAPELVASIKRRIDEQPDRMGQFVLTGSQQWHVLKHMSESLAGRVAFLDLEGFSLAEQSGEADGPVWLQDWLNHPDDFTRHAHRRLKLQRSVLEVLWRGTLPRACLSESDLVPDLWSGYIRTYIERDARLLADLSDWQQFGMFLRLMASLTAKEINFSQLGRDIGVTPQTAKRWLRVLQGTFQWFELPAFSGNMVKRVSSKPKGYLADTGLVCRTLDISTPGALAGHIMFGALFETFIAAELRKLLSLTGRGAALHHWRSVGGAEVDILIERDGIHYPIEVKGAGNAGRRDASGIHAFRKSYPALRVAPGLVIAPVPDVRPLSDHAILVPWDLIA
jgi:hypothetical protein